MHLRRAPYIPRVKDWEDTKYFQEEEPVSDINTATTEDEHALPLTPNEGQPSKRQGTQISQHYQEVQHIVPSAALKIPPKPDEAIPDAVPATGAGLKNPLVSPRISEAPTTGATLVEPSTHLEQRENVKPKVKKEKKRPRDIILRDAATGPSALEARKAGAFLGYEYRQPVMAKDIVERVAGEDLAKVKFKNYRAA
jgi:hypothetical protein